MTVSETCKLAKDNVAYPALLSTAEKNDILKIIANALLCESAMILDANTQDINGNPDLPSHIIDRLLLTEERISDIGKGILRLIELDDPVGKVLDEWVNGSGLLIRKVSVPLGVVGIIYEARPNVTCDVVALSVKTGNAIVLRGSKDAIFTNKAIVSVIKRALVENGYNAEFIQLIEDVTHEGATEFMRADEYVDVLLPRGGANFIKTVKRNSTIPVIETGAGNCHLYVEKSADIEIATKILLNGKLQRPSVCNALESLIIDAEIAEHVIPLLCTELKNRGVIVHGCEVTKKYFPDAVTATEDDYYKEYLAYEISCKVVNGIDEAIAHINEHSTHHSDAIITQNDEFAKRFTQEIDSAAVYVNASTRFTDGFEFGFGAEMGISTQKLHARGPIGLQQLTGYKYVIMGKGQIRK